MSRIQDILEKAERDGSVFRMRSPESAASAAAFADTATAVMPPPRIVPPMPDQPAPVRSFVSPAPLAAVSSAPAMETPVEEPLPRFGFHFLVERAVGLQETHQRHASSFSCAFACAAMRWQASASSSCVV